MSRSKNYNNTMSKDGSISPILKDIKLCNAIRLIAKKLDKNVTTVIENMLRERVDEMFKNMTAEEKAEYFDMMVR